jgi:ABC-type bacteriocin/lantibiotic exporter with double-glycine peptidase domain
LQRAPFFSFTSRLVTNIRALFSIADLRPNLRQCFVFGICLFSCEVLIVVSIDSLVAGLDVKNTVSRPIWKDSFYQSLCLVLTFGGLRSVFQHSIQLAAHNADFDFTKEARLRLFDAALKLGIRIGPSRILYLINEVVPKNGYMVTAVCLAISSLTTGLLLLGFGLYKSPIEALVTAAIFSPTLAAYTVLKRKSEYDMLSAKVENSFTEISDSVTYAIRNRLFLKLTDRLQPAIEATKLSILDYRRLYRSLARKLAFEGVAPTVIAIVSILLSVFLINSITETTSSAILSFLYVALRLSKTLGELNKLGSHIDFNSKGLDSLIDVINKSSAEPYSTQSDTFTGEKVSSIDKIELKGVCFSYSSDSPLIENVNLDLKRGQLALLKGPSGSGKSTLLSIIAGDLQPNKGFLRINGQTGLPVNFYEKVSYVGPEPIFFAGTLKSNLSPYSEILKSEVYEKTFSDLNIEFLLDRLDETVEFLPSLSSGQIKRIEIARALLTEPELLIMDEPTANLDEENSQQLVRLLKDLSQNMIVIVSTHQNHFDDVSQTVVRFPSCNQGVASLC